MNSGIDQLSAALAGEHAAIYGYGLAGAHLDRADAETARAAEAAHRLRRDQVLLRLTDMGATPPPAAAAYAPPFPVVDKASALRLALLIEERMAALWYAALPQVGDEDRPLALDGLVDCAVRATGWRRAAGVSPATVPFPGRPA